MRKHGIADDMMNEVAWVELAYDKRTSAESAFNELFPGLIEVVDRLFRGKIF